MSDLGVLEDLSHEEIQRSSQSQISQLIYLTLAENKRYLLLIGLLGFLGLSGFSLGVGFFAGGALYFSLIS